MASAEGQDDMTKYKAKKAVVDGITFDSRREAARYTELVLLSRAGKIIGLTLQVPFVLAPSVKFSGARAAKPAIRYFADFVYSDVELGKIVVEDVKSPATAKLAAFQIKRHLMLSVHGIDVKVVH